MVPDEFGSGMKLVRVSSVYTVPVFIRYRYLYISSCVEFIQSKFKMATWNRNLPDNLIQNQTQMRKKITLAGLMNIDGPSSTSHHSVQSRENVRGSQLGLY